MCNSAVHRPFVEPFPFSTFQFLRTCNRLMLPTDVRQYYTVIKDNKTFDPNESSKQHQSLPTHKSLEPTPNPDNAILFPSSTAFPKDIAHSAMPPILTCSSSPRSPEAFDYGPDIGSTPSHLPSLTYSNLFSRRQRGEKRPIPDEQKDEKYYERRKRNNEAAKKSRDARKLREDRVAFRAAILEHENAILRAQLVALRDEMTTLRQMMAPRATQISLNL